MRQRLIPIVFSLLGLLVLPSPVSAQEEGERPEARLQGYTTTVELTGGGGAMAWFLTLAMAGACAGVMFMSAKRSHLD
jgi:hypothetical protein